MIALIVAYAKNRVIGNKGQIPWRIKGEQKRFKELTTGNVVVMGRRSYEEIGRPLPNRMTYVISSTKNFDEDGVKTVGSLQEAIDHAAKEDEKLLLQNEISKARDIYISGGARLYEEAIDIADVMFNTEIDAEIEGDTFFPVFDKKDYVKTVEKCVEGDIPYKYVTYTRIKYPRKCPCCNEGIINEPYDICDICGWEDDRVQNNDREFAGGANSLSLTDHCKEYFKDKKIRYYPVKELDDTGLVTTVYTTKTDSAWKYGKDGAFQNCIRLASTLGINPQDMVMLNQTHTDGIRVITRKEGGEMVIRPMEKDGYDGMITNEKGMLLCTVEADCVPIFLTDPVKEAVGMVHSGWKGTSKQIAVNAVKLMMERYGSDPKDILIGIGPCICVDCYEVSNELRDEFADMYDESDLEEIFVNPHEPDKYNLDLKKAIRISLIKAGVIKEHIFDTNRCTKEDEELCSWRRDNPVMKSILTGIMLKQHEKT